MKKNIIGKSRKTESRGISYFLLVFALALQFLLANTLLAESLENEQTNTISSIKSEDGSLESDIPINDVQEESKGGKTQEENPEANTDSQQEPTNIEEEPSYFWKPDETFYKELRLRQEEALLKSRQAADDSQDRVSQRLHSFSSYVDRFFAEEDYIKENYESRLKINITNQYQARYTPTLRPHMSLHLALPNTKNKWSLSVESDDSNEVELTQDANNLINDNQDSTLATSLGRKLKSSELLDVSFDMGIKFRTPIDPFAKLKLRKAFIFDNVELRFTEVLGWRDSEGYYAENNFVFEYPLTTKYFFRSGSTLTYWDIHSYWTGSQALILYRQLDKKSLIAYTVGINGQNEDTLHTRKKDQVNQYWVEARYRKNFYKNWLFYQITPGVTWPREFDFDALPRIEFKLEAVYGYSKISNEVIREIPTEVSEP